MCASQPLQMKLRSRVVGVDLFEIALDLTILIVYSAAKEAGEKLDHTSQHPNILHSQLGILTRQ